MAKRSFKHLIVTCGAVFILQGCATTNSYERVDTFPGGKQFDFMTSLLTSGYEVNNSVIRRFPASEDKVWAAVQKATKLLERVGGRSVIYVDDDMKKVQNGSIGAGTRSTAGAGKGAWIDEFVTTVYRLSPNETQVKVYRRLVELDRNKTLLGYQSKWTPRKSNGKIESWLLTQIENELAL